LATLQASSSHTLVQNVMSKHVLSNVKERSFMFSLGMHC
jgi:hypothetical protein